MLRVGRAVRAVFWGGAISSSCPPSSCAALGRAAALVSAAPPRTRGLSALGGVRGQVQHKAVRAMATMAVIPPLISAKELQMVLRNASKDGGEKVTVLDGSWHLGGSRDAKAEFEEAHIEGAAFFDIDAVSEQRSSLPHMLPSEDAFAAAVSSLGITNQDSVFVYTAPDCFSAARVWWTFRCFGHNNVHVLQGGLNAWKAIGGNIESGAAKSKPPSRPPRALVEVKGNAWLIDKQGFQATLQPSMVKGWRRVLEIAEAAKQERAAAPEVGDTAGADDDAGGSSRSGSSPRLVDARSLDRFHGRVPEPRAGLEGGHVPGSVCVPFQGVLQEGDWTSFKGAQEIREVFEAAGVDVDNPAPLVTMCGSGVTGAVLTLALQLAGRDASRTPLYDGSWSEWGAREDLPKEL